MQPYLEHPAMATYVLNQYVCEILAWLSVFHVSAKAAKIVSTKAITVLENVTNNYHQWNHKVENTSYLHESDKAKGSLMGD